jgi:hypothetical protein
LQLVNISLSMRHAKHSPIYSRFTFVTSQQRRKKMCDNQYKLGVRLSQLDCEDSLGYHKKADWWENAGAVVGCIGFAVVLYSYFT